MRTAGSHTESGHHLVEDEDDAVLVADGAELFQKARLGRNAAHVACNRLYDDAGHLVFVRLGQFAYVIGIVVARQERVFGVAIGYARRVRLTQRERTAACGNQEEVAVAVVVAGKLDDLIASRVAPCHAGSAHGGFGAGVDHADLLDGGHQIAHQFGYLDLNLGRRAKRCGRVCRVFHAADDIGMGVPKEHWSPRPDPM